MPSVSSVADRYDRFCSFRAFFAVSLFKRDGKFGASEVVAAGNSPKPSVKKSSFTSHTLLDPAFRNVNLGCDWKSGSNWPRIERVPKFALQHISATQMHVTDSHRCVIRVWKRGRPSVAEAEITLKAKSVNLTNQCKQLYLLNFRCNPRVDGGDAPSY